MAVGPSHRVLEAQLPPDWDAQQVYDNHQVLMRHGKDTCTWRAPRCGACILLDLCPHGQRRTGAAGMDDLAEEASGRAV
jgi:endonuclease III